MKPTKKWYKHNIKELLDMTCGCGIQNFDDELGPWTCGTCFFSINDKFTNMDWQTILYIRGDYKKKDLNNLPKNINKRLERIIEILQESL